MKHFTLPRKPIQIMSHPTDKGWIFEDCELDKNYTVEVEGHYDDNSDWVEEIRSYKINHRINHLKENGTAEILFLNRKFPWQYKNIEIKESNFLPSPTTTTINYDNIYRIQHDYPLDFRFFITFCTTMQNEISHNAININQKRTTIGFIREGDRELLENNCKNRMSDSAVIIFDRYTGISKTIEPYPKWKTFRSPTLAISNDGLTIITCYDNNKDGTCLSAIFDNPLID